MQQINNDEKIEQKNWSKSILIRFNPLKPKTSKYWKKMVLKSLKIDLDQFFYLGLSFNTNLNLNFFYLICINFSC